MRRRFGGPVPVVGCRRGSSEAGSAGVLVAAVFVPAAVAAAVLPAWGGVIVAVAALLVAMAYVAVGLLVALGRHRQVRGRLWSQTVPQPATVLASPRVQDRRWETAAGDEHGGAAA